MLQDELLFLFLFRVLVASLIVIFATILAERVSAFYASLIGAFPTSAGPAYIMLAIKEDASFVAHSALYSMASMADYLIIYLKLFKSDHCISHMLITIYTFLHIRHSNC